MQKAAKESINKKLEEEISYGYEMLSSILDAVFKQYRMDHIDYVVLNANAPSRALVHKLKGKLVYDDGVGSIYKIHPTE